MGRLGHLIDPTGGRAAKAVGVDRLHPGKLPGGTRLSTRPGFLVKDNHPSLTPFERGLKGIDQSRTKIGPHHQPVHHDFHPPFLPGSGFQRFTGTEFDQLSVHPGPDKPLPGQPLQDIPVLPPLFVLNGGQQHQACASRQGHDLIRHFAHGLRGNRFAGFGIVGLPDMRVKQPKVVIDFGGGRNGGAGTAGTVPLLDGDGRGKTVEMVQIRLGQLIQKLAGKRAQALDVPALPLGEEGVKGEGGLATAAGTRDHHQLVPGNLHRNILEIVLAGTPKADHITSHSEP